MIQRGHDTSFPLGEIGGVTLVRVRSRQQLQSDVAPEPRITRAGYTFPHRAGPQDLDDLVDTHC